MNSDDDKKKDLHESLFYWLAVGSQTFSQKKGKHSSKFCKKYYLVWFLLQ